MSEQNYEAIKNFKNMPTLEAIKYSMVKKDPKRNRKVLEQKNDISPKLGGIVPTIPSILNVDTNSRTSILTNPDKTCPKLRMTASLLNSTQEEFNKVFSSKSKHTI